MVAFTTQKMWSVGCDGSQNKPKGKFSTEPLSWGTDYMAVSSLFVVVQIAHTGPLRLTDVERPPRPPEPPPGPPEPPPGPPQLQTGLPGPPFGVVLVVLGVVVVVLDVVLVVLEVVLVVLELIPSSEIFGVNWNEIFGVRSPLNLQNRSLLYI